MSYKNTPIYDHIIIELVWNIVFAAELDRAEWYKLSKRSVMYTINYIVYFDSRRFIDL